MLPVTRLVAPLLILLGVTHAHGQTFVPQPGTVLIPVHPIGLTAAARPTAPPAPMPKVVYPDARARSAGATARRARDGHFYFQTTVNGTPLPMLFDTGAGAVSLRAEDAEKAGIDPNRLSYTVRTQTANGAGSAAPVTLATLTIGDITRHDVAALVHRPGTLGVNLLGQSFTARLKGLKVDGDQLLLEGE